jgi:type 1 fimbria pilin
MKCRSGSVLNRVLVLSATASLFALTSLFLFSSPAAAADLSLTVHGYVTDSNGDPVVGADVLVEVLSGTYPTRATTTDGAGHYQIVTDFTLSEWNVGDTVRTTVTYGGEPESNTAVADDDGVVQIDVQLTLAIPEFGSLTGVLVTMGIIGIIATVSMRRKKA